MNKSPSRYARAKARADLMRKYWGNAYMGGNDRTCRELQSARLEAWQHGMKIGLAAGIKLARKP